jgi:hypothetical protein
VSASPQPPIYAATALARGLGEGARLAAVEIFAERMAREGGGTLLLPAGFLHATTGSLCDRFANLLRALSHRTGVGFAFGIDLGAEPGEGVWAAVDAGRESLLFACDAGRPIFWPARPLSRHDAREAASEPRVLTMKGLSLGLLLGAEVFNPALRLQLERERPSLLGILTHRGPTHRWRGVLRQLGTVAPVIVVGGAVDEEAAHPPSLSAGVILTRYHAEENSRSGLA